MHLKTKHLEKTILNAFTHMYQSIQYQFNLTLRLVTPHTSFNGHSKNLKNVTEIR